MKYLLVACFLCVAFVSRAQIRILADSAVAPDGIYVLAPHKVSLKHVICKVYDKKTAILKRQYALLSKRKYLDVSYLRHYEETDTLIPDGISMDFYPNAVIKRKLTYAMNVLCGKGAENFPTGELKKDFEYSNLGKLLVENEYSIAGTLKKTTNYFYPSGLLKSEIAYQGDKTETKYYLGDGVKYRETLEDLARNEFRERIFYANGRVKREANFKNGKLNGDFKLYTIDSVLIRLEHFEMNKSTESTCLDKDQKVKCSPLIDSLKIDDSSVALSSQFNALLNNDLIKAQLKDSAFVFRGEFAKDGSLQKLICSGKRDSSLCLVLVDWLKARKIKPEQMNGEAVSFKLTVALAKGNLPFKLIRTLSDGDSFDPEYILTNGPEYQKPAFIGGSEALTKYFSKKLRYPPLAKKEGISGRVWVRFVVDKSGIVRNCRVVNGVSREIDAEAVRLICEMPKWTPASKYGYPANAEYTLPVVFKIEK